MIGWVLERADLDPTVINGGIVNTYGSNTRLGEGDWMVVEADESDGSFVRLPATAVIVTNMDPEHLENYGSFDDVRDAYDAFVGNIPFYGFAALCTDHPKFRPWFPGCLTGGSLPTGWALRLMCAALICACATAATGSTLS